MTVTSTRINLPDDNAIYMLHYGEYEDTAVLGPYIGQSNLDFDRLSTEYRHDRYALNEAEKNDHCILSESDFVDWLLENSILLPIESRRIHVELSSSWDFPYIPNHWPECPVCRMGRGRPETGQVRKSLNRLAIFNRCTECANEWNFTEIPNNSALPMFEDDGRDTLGGCVPFAISKACALPFSAVLSTCKKYGWNSSTGMYSNQALIATRELGFELKWLGQYGTTSPTPPTLKQVIHALHYDRNYVIGVKNHWLALVNGRVVDNDTATGLAKRVIEIYEVCKVESHLT